LNEPDGTSAPCVSAGLRIASSEILSSPSPEALLLVYVCVSRLCREKREVRPTMLSLFYVLCLRTALRSRKRLRAQCDLGDTALWRCECNSIACAERLADHCWLPPMVFVVGVAKQSCGEHVRLCSRSSSREICASPLRLRSVNTPNEHSHCIDAEISQWLCNRWDCVHSCALGYLEMTACSLSRLLLVETCSHFH
jgi:hypothetical protein